VNQQVIEAEGSDAPCPFCDALDGIVCELAHENERAYAVVCQSCGGQGPIEGTREDAIEGWKGADDAAELSDDALELELEHRPDLVRALVGKAMLGAAVRELVRVGAEPESIQARLSHELEEAIEDDG
jgi:transcription elongation factor Elf1